jgi:hypothetical protein
MLTFHKLLTLYGIDPSDVRLVRHGNKELPVLEVFRNNLEKFTHYTAWQRQGKYGNSKYIAVFAPARSTTSLFLGLWSIDGMTLPKDQNAKHLTMLKKNELPEKWFNKAVYYRLQKLNVMQDMSERLVVDWANLL